MRGVNEAHGVTHATRLDVMTMPASSAETIVSDADSLNRDISVAKKRSISDGPAPLSSDGQTIYKIIRMVHSQQVLEAILSSPHLEHCRARVGEADCEVLPKWANGAKS